MKTQNLFEKEVVWHRNDTGNTHASSRPRWLIPAVGGSAAALFLAILLALLVLRGGSGCDGANQFLPQIVSLELKGQYDLAASAAQTALATPQLCSAAHTPLTEHFVNASLDAIFATPADPRDWITQTQLTDREETIQQIAQQADVTFPSDIQIAQRAASESQFGLSLHAWEMAFTDGEVSSTDRDSVRQYVDALTTEGFWAAQASGTTRDTGLSMLMTAYTLQNQLQVGSGEPYAYLVRFLGSDQATWPTTLYPSPLLPTTGSQSTPGVH